MLMTKARFQFMERVLDKARQEKPIALIVEMDTPAASLETSKILRPFQDLSFPTFTFVNTHAESAGSLIALATGSHLHVSRQHDRLGLGGDWLWREIYRAIFPRK